MNFNTTNINNIQVLVQNQTLTTSGSVQVTIDTSQYKEYYFTVRIDGPVTGTSPTIQFTLFDQDLFGVSVTGNSTDSGVYTSTILSQSFKHDTQTGLMQLNWTITGISPSFGGVYAAITGIKDAFITGQATMANSTPVVIASDQSAVTVTGTITTSPNVNIHDSAGNNLTSQVNGVQRALDVGIDVAGVQVDPRSIRALTSGTDSISVLQATASSLNAEVQGDAASGSAKSGNPVQIGGVFNTTQPTVITGQVVEAQSTARGAQIVATGVDNFNINNISGTISLPTGAATSANQTTEITSLQILDDVPAANNAAFSKGNPAMGQLDDTSTVVATEDNVSVVRITAQRAFHTNLRNNAGTEIATSANPLRIDPTGTTTQPVSGTVAVTQSTSPWVVSGTVTANAGTGTFTTQDTSSLVDNNPFTDNSSRVLPAGYVFDDVAGTALTENDIAAARIDSKRAQVFVIEDATTRGQKAAVSSAGALSENLTQVGGSSITLGQKTMANSLPVVLASDQTSIPVVASSSITATYSSSTTGLATGLLATDIFTITGSGTKTIKIKKIRITANRSGSTTTDIFLVKRSTANSGGTSTAETMISHDSGDAAATAVIRSYTVNPTLGTTVGTLRVQKQFINVAATGTTDVINWEFGQDTSKPIVLNGTSQVLAVNLGGVTITAPSFDIYIEWIEV